MSEQLEHKELDPQVCPRCGCEWTDHVGLDHNRDEDDDWLPAEIRQCEECANREKEHGGDYQVFYRKVLMCVEWTDDDGVAHTLHDTQSVKLDAVDDLFEVAVLFEDLTRNGIRPGSEDLARLQAAIDKAKGIRP